MSLLSALECDRPSCPCHATASRGVGLTHCVGPSHARGDQDPSLSITTAEGGKTLLNCKSGCSNADVISALQERGLWGSAKTGERRVVATYDYVDRTGALVLQVQRYEPKDFSQRKPDGKGGWLYKLGDIEKPLYHLDEVVAAVERGETIWIVEGERDADTLRGVGLIATCSVGGAGKWLDPYSSDLIGATVVVIADKDDAGRRHAKDVAQKLAVVAKSVKVVELPGEKIKDASDFLSAGGTVVGLTTIVARTPEWDAGDARVILTAREIVDEYRGVLERRKAKDPDEIGWPTGFFELDVIPVRYRPRDLWLIVSATGVGKTTFLLTLMRQAKVRSLFVTMEQPRVQLMDRLTASMARVNSAWLTKGDWNDAQAKDIDRALTQITTDDQLLMVDQPNLTTDALDPIVRVAHARFGVRLVFVDYAQKMADRYGESEYQRVTRISNNLARIASSTGTCVVAATQVSRKYRSTFGKGEERSDGEPPKLSDIRDSGYLEQDASVVLAIGRAENSNQAKVAVRKNRHGLTGPVVTFWFDGAHNRFAEMSKAVEEERPYL